jgi:dolichyl-phosphate-mannose--protein O-mannosyl transferase
LEIVVGSVGGQYFATTLLQIAVINENNQVVPIQSITGISGTSTGLNGLINDQKDIHYPVDYMENTYFDEIYFARTAEGYLHLQMPYEWTHPPLGKLIQAGGIAIFGLTPFGWRIMGVIFATLMVAVTYLLGKKLLGTWIGGFTAAFLMTFDFMHFTMGRMGTADTYLVFFEVTSLLFFLIYLKNAIDKGWKTSVLPLGLACVFFALALSSKFAIALFGFVGELFVLLVMRLHEVKNLKGTVADKIYAFLDRPYSALVLFLLMAIGIYFLTYIPDMLAGRSFIDVLNLQQQMYVYHSTLTATRWYDSTWYSWPFMFNPFNPNMHVPIWLSAGGSGVTSEIDLLGNPAVWWVGFAAVVGLTVYFVLKFATKKFDFKANLPVVFILVFFFFQWLPYIFITRQVYIYHFYSSVPILCLGSAYFVSKYWSYKWMKIAAVAYFALTIGLFVLFYPIISGVPTSQAYIHSLTWFKSWILG